MLKYIRSWGKLQKVLFAFIVCLLTELGSVALVESYTLHDINWAFIFILPVVIYVVNIGVPIDE